MQDLLIKSCIPLQDDPKKCSYLQKRDESLSDSRKKTVKRSLIEGQFYEDSSDIFTSILTRETNKSVIVEKEDVSRGLMIVGH